MNKLYNEKINPINVVVGAIILVIGFINLTIGWISPALAPYSLAITGILAVGMVFGVGSIKDLFNKSVRPIHNFFIFLAIALIVSVVTGVILQMVLKLNLESNPVAGHIPWNIPFMLLGEELMGFYVFIVTACLLKDNKGKLVMATIVSAIVFALVHVPTYWNGSVVKTLIHVLLLQGVGRLILNAAGVKSNSIIVPWIVHLVFDLITLGAVYFL